MKSFDLKILEADSVFEKGEALSITVPTPDGELCFMADHEPTVCAVKEGLVHYTLAGDLEDDLLHYAAVSSGIMRFENNEALLLVESAEDPVEIDAIRSKEALKAARDELKLKQGRVETQMAEAKIRRELNRGDQKQKHGTIKKAE